MQIYGPSHVHGTQGAQGPHLNRIKAPSQTTESSSVAGDHLDISPAAEAVIQAAENQDSRVDRIAQIRSEIAAGTYDTNERLAAAMDGLLDEVG